MTRSNDGSDNAQMNIGNIFFFNNVLYTMTDAGLRRMTPSVSELAKFLNTKLVLDVLGAIE